MCMLSTKKTSDRASKCLAPSLKMINFQGDPALSLIIFESMAT